MDAARIARLRRLATTWRIAESRLIVAIDAMLPGAALQSARWLRGDDPCVLSRNVRSALADLIDPEGE